MTIKQKQCLLAYLGYYTKAIDGIWGGHSADATRRFQHDFGGLAVDGIAGEQTQKALRNAVAYGMPARKESNKSENADFFADLKFSKENCKCKCGGKYCDGYPAEMQEDVCRIVDDAVAHFGKPWNPKEDIISALRCKTHNANEGGVANSQHMYGEAIDFRIRGVSAADLLAYLQKDKRVRYAYAINGTNVHVDINQKR